METTRSLSGQTARPVGYQQTQRPPEVSVGTTRPVGYQQRCILPEISVHTVTHIT